MPRWFAHLLIVLGWLVTPLLAWGASYAGLWVGALVGTRFTAPLTMLAVAGIGAALPPPHPVTRIAAIADAQSADRVFMR